jgi:diguanylate cyclase (GGDEF)-like protein
MRTKTVPAFALVIGLLAIAAIVLLQQQSNANRTAELHLSNAETELRHLQSAPFRAVEKTGGSPAYARAMMRTSSEHVYATLDELSRHDDAPTSLRGMRRLLDADVATLQRIYRLGATQGTYGPAADRLSAIAAIYERELVGRLDAARHEYDRRSASSQLRATIGSGVVIALLLVAFTLLYGRSVRARAFALRLARENSRLLAASRAEALTDPLTGLGNRRALTNDLDAAFAETGGELFLALYDLDGFKGYNDTFGHPAGDALLARLGERLQAAVTAHGAAYRMGGDEFCILVRGDGRELAVAAAAALTETGEGFAVGCSYGTARVPADATTPSEALRLADQRLYENKAQRAPASRESTDVLLRVLSERSPDLGDHLNDVADLAARTAQHLGLPRHEVERIRLAAELHDVGKAAIPDSILSKPGPLDAEEWAFMHRHTIIGERIVRAAPSLAPAADLVRSSHERHDGAGYPDGLRGDEIALGASVIAACDALDAMVTDRPYRAAMPIADALAELRRCAGSQFHPRVVDALVVVAQEREPAPASS